MRGLRTRQALGLSPLPAPVQGPRVIEEHVEPPRESLPVRHHSNLDATAIKVRATHMPLLAGRCFCCEVSVSEGWLCPTCVERGCAA